MIDRVHERPSTWFALALAALTFAGCESTVATTTAKPAGFLGDYDSLRPGTDGEAQFVYIDPQARFHAYDSLLLESVTFWVGHSGDAASVDRETQQMLTDRLYRALHDRLAKDYKLVTKPGPTTMRLRAAITGAKDARVVLNAVTTTVPQLRMLAKLGDLDHDTAVLVGKASVECEILDSLTDTRLAAGIDERMGNKTMKTAFTQWGDVESAFEFWAERLAERLKKARAGDLTPVGG